LGSFWRRKYNCIAAGASTPWSGTRLSNLGANENITFTSPQTYYWNLPAGGNFHTDACLATTSGGTVNINNYPLAQDTVVFNNAGLNSGSIVTFSQRIFQGIDASALTNSATFDIQSGVLVVNKFKLSSSITLVNDSAFIWFLGTRSWTHAAKCEADTAGISINSSVRLFNVKLYGNLVGSGEIRKGAGSTDFNGYNITCDDFNISNSNRAEIHPKSELYFGSGTITSRLFEIVDISSGYSEYLDDIDVFPETATIVIGGTDSLMISPPNITWKKIEVTVDGSEIKGNNFYIEELVINGDPAATGPYNSTNDVLLAMSWYGTYVGTPNTTDFIYVKSLKAVGTEYSKVKLTSSRTSPGRGCNLVSYGETNNVLINCRVEDIQASPSGYNYWYAPTSLGNVDEGAGTSGFDFTGGYSNNAMGVFL